jgi:hypothetical protein
MPEITRKNYTFRPHTTYLQDIMWAFSVAPAHCLVPAQTASPIILTSSRPPARRFPMPPTPSSSIRTPWSKPDIPEFPQSHAPPLLRSPPNNSDSPGAAFSMYAPTSPDALLGIAWRHRPSLPRRSSLPRPSPTHILDARPCLNAHLAMSRERLSQFHSSPLVALSTVYFPAGQVWSAPFCRFARILHHLSQPARLFLCDTHLSARPRVSPSSLPAAL